MKTRKSTAFLSDNKCAARVVCENNMANTEDESSILRKQATDNAKFKKSTVANKDKIIETRRFSKRNATVVNYTNDKHGIGSEVLFVSHIFGFSN